MRRTSTYARDRVDGALSFGRSDSSFANRLDFVVELPLAHD
jgi:hypothetical protein